MNEFYNALKSIEIDAHEFKSKSCTRSDHPKALHIKRSTASEYLGQVNKSIERYLDGKEEPAMKK